MQDTSPSATTSRPRAITHRLGINVTDIGAIQDPRAVLTRQPSTDRSGHPSYSVSCHCYVALNRPPSPLRSRAAPESEARRLPGHSRSSGGLLPAPPRSTAFRLGSMPPPSRFPDIRAGLDVGASLHRSLCTSKSAVRPSRTARTCVACGANARRSSRGPCRRPYVYFLHDTITNLALDRTHGHCET